MDSQVLGHLLDDDNEADSVWADSAYRSEAIEQVLALMGFDSQIHERCYRNRPLSEEQQHSNRTKSKTRSKVEHVFGAWIMQMGGKLVRVIGMVRVKASLGLKHLTYNLMRYTFLQTQVAD
nr:transposase [Thermoleptolyngbya sp. M55_K2018_002]